MVKHHVKRKGGKSSSTKKANELKNIKEQLIDIDRFNGSSESEGEGDNDGENVDNDDLGWDEKLEQQGSSGGASTGEDSEEGEEEISMKGREEGVARGEDGESEDDGEDDGDEEDSGDDEGDEGDSDGDGGDEATPKGGMGMAGAMSKILASAGALSESARIKGKDSLVLTKTVTKHMKVITKEERDERAMKKKRAERRKKNLKVMYVPTKTGDPKVIESERTLRRIATRGVVALFNAISTHQHEAKLETEPEDRKSRKERDAKFETKQGFIDKLKTAAGAEEKEEGEKEKGDKKEKKDDKKGKKVQETKTEGSKWLQDDFLMKSKLKDWDKDDEDSSDDEEIGFVKDGDADLEDAKEYDERKRKEGELEEARGRKERKDKARAMNKKRKTK
ncbi:hypothetical protein TrCOL_g5496 [Triparma columacea]|uniref:RRP15-like protein n=1 Tax=Triparma columacea TaxID=722753 RepID=A0A9W7LC24_9STRA|nr:hypothetical protein TrCOL_g5496 [Triparma columacea]